MNYKYTSDGRKVLVVGQLNAKETIVQEVFVSGETEVPSGENFVVKSLHEEPVKSWKEKKLEELKLRYEKDKEHWEREIKKADKTYSAAVKKSSLKAQAFLKFANHGDEPELRRLVDFLSGDITHYVFLDRSPEIRTVDDNANFDTEAGYSRFKIEAIKLISLFGSDDGSLSFRINQYRDGSGYWKTMHPCCSYKQALKLVQDHVDNLAASYLDEEDNKVTSINLKSWQAIDGLEIPQAILDKEKEKEIKNSEKKVIAAEQALNKAKENLRSLNSPDK